MRPPVPKQGGSCRINYTRTECVLGTVAIPAVSTFLQYLDPVNFRCVERQWSEVGHLQPVFVDPNYWNHVRTICRFRLAGSRVYRRNKKSRNYYLESVNTTPFLKYEVLFEPVSWFPIGEAGAILYCVLACKMVCDAPAACRAFCFCKSLPRPNRGPSRIPQPNPWHESRPRSHRIREWRPRWP